MSENGQNPIPPDSAPQRALENLTRRVIWTEEVTECRNCETEVELRSGHYYLTLSEEPDDSDSQSRDLVFCSRPCAAEYFRSQP